MDHEVYSMHLHEAAIYRFMSYCISSKMSLIAIEEIREYVDNFNDKKNLKAALDHMNMAISIDICLQ